MPDQPSAIKLHDPDDLRSLINSLAQTLIDAERANDLEGFRAAKDALLRAAARLGTSDA